MATLDGQRVFGDGEPQIEAFSLNRQWVERTVAGLDGVVSIDLGGRSRKIRQRGMLRVRSNHELRTVVDAISAYMDGRARTLVTQAGEEFADLRMDSVKVSPLRVSGPAVVVDYEILYTQLAV
jgi:hypothetical protein